MNFLGRLYSTLFEGLYGRDLSDFLWGFNGVDFSGPNLYNRIGFIALIVSIVSMVIYHFIWDSANTHKLRYWFIMMISNCVINLFIGVGLLLPKFNQGYISSGLNVVSLDCWMFSLSNGIMSILFFFILSVIFKRFANNTRNTPWKSLWPKF